MRKFTRPFVLLLVALTLTPSFANSQTSATDNGVDTSTSRIGVPASAERILTEIKYVVKRPDAAGVETTRPQYVQVMMSKVGHQAFVFPTFQLESATLDGRPLFEGSCSVQPPKSGARLRLDLLDTMIDADKRESIKSTLSDSGFKTVEEPNFTSPIWSATLRLQSQRDGESVASGWFKRSGRRITVELRVPDASVFSGRTSQELVLEIGNTYTAYYEQDVLRGSYVINTAALGRLRDSLSGQPGTPTDYLIVLGGEIAQNRRLEAQITQALEVSVRTPHRRAADPALVERMLRDTLEASRQQLDLAKLDRSKFITVMLGDLLQIAVPVGELTTVTNKLKKDITDHRTDVIEKLRKGSTEVSGSGSVSYGPISGSSSGSFKDSHENFDKSHVERLWKLLEELDRSAGGKVPYATGISFAQLLDDSLASTTTGRISIGSFLYQDAAYAFPLSFSGFCAPGTGKYKVAELVLDSRTIDRNTHLVAERIVIPAGTVIDIPFGHSLTIEAGTLVLGGHVQINGRGQKGATGSGGAGAGQWDTDNLKDWQNSCVGEWDRGGTGGKGASGFDGARVKIIYSALQGDLNNLDDDGLRGGDGGDGGGGGPGRLCRGPDRTAHQKYGPGGHRGESGLQGRDGSLLIKRQ